MNLCIAGKNNIAVDILLYALNFFSNNDICVITNKTDNFRNTWQKSLGFYANLLGIKIKTLAEVQEIEDLIFLSLEFDRIINPAKFKTKKLFNIHFSYLPEYKGMFTSLLPILHGKEYSGVSLHKIDKGIDTGDIIDQIKFNIQNTTSIDLYFKYLEYGTLLVKKNFTNLLNDDYLSFKQPFINSTYYSKESFDFSNTGINIYQTGYQISSFVNALYFRPYQLATFRGYKINRVEIIDCDADCKVGQIIEENESYILVKAIDSCIKLFKDYYDDLIEAIEHEDISRINYYSKFIKDINEVDRNGWNPMIKACYSGNLEAVLIIQKNGGSIHTKNLNGTTTLMYAKSAYEKKKDIRLIKYLLENGVSPNCKDIKGKTVLDYTNDYELLKLFKEYD
ncbi:hypothetical protein CEN47_16370 [Fischerella thermalis CCMEE 5319]|nr:hypothetical protein CEN47_16370 [Fischerella thermalis CCMEE 5319]